VANPRYKRSTNVVYDFGDKSSTQGIIITNPIQSLVKNLYLASTVENASKAISIIGPYGTGKSTGLLFALKYFSNNLPHDQEQELIKFHTDDEPLGTVKGKKITPQKYYHPCILLGKRDTLNSALVAELKAVGNTLGLKLRKGQIVDLIETVLDKLKSKGKGLIIVVDELGKFLENAVDNPSDGDVYILQEIAELATRRAGELIIITSRHQSFEAYASSLSNAEINEWKKIQGRYHDIVFQSNQKESIIFISQALEALDYADYSPSSREISYYKKHVKASRDPIFEDFSEIVDSTRCLHPIVTTLMTPLFKKLAQNERSVFSFIFSPENHSLNTFLQENKTAVYKLHNLFNYIASNLSFALGNTNLANIWSQIESTLIRFNDLTELELEVFKTVCILDMFRDALHLDPNEDNISFAIQSSDKKDKNVLNAIKSIEKKGAITCNDTWNTYHVKYGGSVDVDALINERIHFEFDINEFANEMNDSLPLSPVLAKAHYAKTGTIRYFSQKYRGENFHIGEEYKNSTDPTIYHILYKSEKAKQSILDSLELNSDNDTIPNGTVLYFIKISNRLEKIYTYYRAIYGVKTQENSVSNDEVAFQRVSKELLKAENDLENELRKIYTVEKSIQIWSDLNGAGKIDSIHSVNRLLSDIFEQKYPNTPHIFNELANKTKPSPSANTGIKALLSNMLNAGKEELGITGGSQLGMYFSIIKKTGLYRWDNGVNGFYKPLDPNLALLWNTLDQMMKECDSDKFTLQEIYTVMANEPFGIKEGLHVILALAFLQSHGGEISWYEEGKFLIDINYSVLELMKRRPQDFSFRYVESSSMNNKFLQNLIKEFKIEGVTSKSVTPLDILAPILSEISSLPDYSKNTEKSLDQSIIKMRRAIFSAKEPETLLYIDLPVTFGLPEFDKMTDDEKTTFIKFFSTGYLNLKTVYPRLLENIREGIYSRFESENRDELYERVSKQKKLHDKKLTPLIKRILDTKQNDDTWVESVASAVIPNPPRFWKDQDFDQFEIELGIMVHRYELLEKLSKSKNIDLISQGKIESAKESILNSPDFDSLSLEEKDYLLTQLIDEVIFKENA